MQKYGYERDGERGGERMKGVGTGDEGQKRTEGEEDGGRLRSRGRESTGEDRRGKWR